MAKKTLG